MFIAKRFAAGFGIAVALPVLINVGVSTFSNTAVSSTAHDRAQTLYDQCQAACWRSVSK